MKNKNSSKFLHAKTDKWHSIYGPTFNPIIVLLNSSLIVCIVLIFTEKRFWGLFGTFLELSQRSPEKWHEDGGYKVSFELLHRKYSKICIKFTDRWIFFQVLSRQKKSRVEWRKDVMDMGSTAELVYIYQFFWPMSEFFSSQNLQKYEFFGINLLNF